MKHLILIAHLYLKNIFSVLFLVVLTTVSTVSMVLTIAQLRYLTETENLYKNSSLVDDVYFSININPEEYGVFEEFSKKMEIRDQIKNIDGVKGITDIVEDSLFRNAYVEKRDLSYLVFSDELVYQFHPRISEGQWLDKIDTYPSGTIPAVAYGSEFDGVQVGDTITYYIMTASNDEDGSEFLPRNFYIVGKINSDNFIPQFGYSGTSITADLFLTQINGAGRLIVRNNDLTKKQLLEPVSDTAIYSNNMFIDFEDNLSNEQREKCIEELRQYGSVLTPEQIIADTEDQNAIKLKKVLPTPLFTFLIATIAFFSLSVLFVYRKIEETNIYYLVGCTKFRNLAHISLGIFGIILPALLVSFAITAWYPVFKTFFYENFAVYNALFDNYSYLYIVGYLLLMLVISIVLPLIISGRASPLEMYRRKDL
ncbi:MAG: hypothetical protein ACI4M3_05635 [Acutalibacteraceae bacterium]